MRALRRPELPDETEAWLLACQGALNRDGSQAPAAHWDLRRPTMTHNGVVAALKRMAGPRERCVWCGDSRGTDIEHYRPKHRFPDHTFRWKNLLWCCSGCNRKKGEQFPTDDQGSPLLLDPTQEDPLRHLFLVCETGVFRPRTDPVTLQEDARGRATTDERLLPLNIEAIAEARARAWRALRRAVESFRAGAKDAEAQGALRQAFLDCERPDVALWVLRHEGAADPPFEALHQEHPALVASIDAVFG